MKLLYHSDIIPKVHAAFMMHTDNVEETHRVFDQYMEILTPDEAAKWNTNPREQIVQLVDRLNAVDDKFSAMCNLPTIVYQPEQIEDKDLRDTFLKSCAGGYFIPFLLSITRNDIEDDFYNILVIVAGVGDYPDENFIFLGASLREVYGEFKITPESIPENSQSIIYPIIYDVIKGVIYSDLTENAITIKSCITHTTEEESQ